MPVFRPLPCVARAAVAVAVAVGALPSRAAFAQEFRPRSAESPGEAARNAPPPPTATFESHGMRGVELMARLGFGVLGSSSPVVYAPQGSDKMSEPGDIFAGRAKPYSGDLSWSLGAGYRIAPIVSAGLFGAYQSAGTSDPQDGTSGTQRAAWMLGAYGRVFWWQLSARVQPWLQLGLAYYDDTQKYGRPIQTAGGQPTTADWTLEYRALAVPVALAVDLRLGAAMAVGPIVEYARLIPLSGCMSVVTPIATGSTSACTNGASDPKIVGTQGTGDFFAGVFAKWTFGGDEPRSELRP
jgi:hypothetical protein